MLYLNLIVFLGVVKNFVCLFLVGCLRLNG